MVQALLLGLTASITPCNFVLYPMLLYRFGISEGETKWKDLLLFVITFLIVTLIIGFIAGVLFSTITWFKLVLGVLFLLYGIYLVAKPGTGIVPKSVENPILLGIILPFTVSVSACVLPFFSILITQEATSISSYVQTAVRFLAFGVGLLLPALLLTLFGAYFMKLVKKFSKVLYYIERIGALLIMISGAYILLDLNKMSEIDIWVFTTLIIGIGLMGVFWFIKNKKIAWWNIVFALIILIWLFFFNRGCIQQVHAQPVSDAVVACGMEESEDSCPVCKTCAWKMIGISTLIGLVYFLSEKKIRIRIQSDA